MSRHTDELLESLERGLAAGTTASPERFLSAVHRRRRRVVMVRAGVASAGLLLAVAAAVALRGPAFGPSAMPGAGGLARSDPPRPDAGSSRMVIGSRTEPAGPGPAPALPVRVGDRPDSPRIRALLEA